MRAISADSNGKDTAKAALSTGPVADARPANWVDRFAPAGLKPWLRLVRADRPIGAWLLLWPCWWSVAFAARADDFLDTWTIAWYLFLFAIGAFAMRSAGCIYNDIIDRDIDAKVARTKERPLASGQISVSPQPSSPPLRFASWGSRFFCSSTHSPSLWALARSASC